MKPVVQALAAAACRRVDAAMEIADLFSDPEAPFDLVAATLDGAHGRYVNEGNEKAYFILEGQGMVFLDDKAYPVKAMDFVAIPKGVSHGIKGQLKFLILCSPPFNPARERKGETLS